MDNFDLSFMNATPAPIAQKPVGQEIQNTNVPWFVADGPEAVATFQTYYVASMWAMLMFIAVVGTLSSIAIYYAENYQLQRKLLWGLIYTLLFASFGNLFLWGVPLLEFLHPCVEFVSIGMLCSFFSLHEAAVAATNYVGTLSAIHEHAKPVEEDKDPSRLDALRFWASTVWLPMRRLAAPGVYAAAASTVVVAIVGAPYWLVFLPAAGAIGFSTPLVKLLDLGLRFREGKRFWSYVHAGDFKRARRHFLKCSAYYEASESFFAIDGIPNVVVNEVVSLIAFLYLLFVNGAKGRIAVFWLYFVNERTRYLMKSLEFFAIAVMGWLPSGEGVAGDAIDMAAGAHAKMQEKAKEFARSAKQLRESTLAKINDSKARVAYAKLLEKSDLLYIKVVALKHAFANQVEQRVHIETFEKKLHQFREPFASMDFIGSHVEEAKKNWKEVTRAFKKMISDVNPNERFQVIRDRCIQLREMIKLSFKPEHLVELSDLEWVEPMYAQRPDVDPHAFWDHVPDFAIFEVFRDVGTSIARGAGVRFEPPSPEEISNVKNLLVATKTLSAVEKAGSFFVKVGKIFLDFAYIRIFGHKFGADQDLLDLIEAWNSMVHKELLPVLRTGNALQSRDLETMQRAYDHGIRVLSLMELKKLKLVDFPFFAHNFESMKTWRATVSARSIARPVPAAVLIAGPASTGKSAAGMKLARLLAHDHGMDSCPDDDKVYSIGDDPADEKKFRDHYHGQLVLLHNDIGNINDSDIQMATISDIMKMLDHAPYTLNAAAVEKKDAIAFSSKYWIGTTNSNAENMCYTTKYMPAGYDAFKTRMGCFIMPMTSNDEYTPLPVLTGESWRRALYAGGAPGGRVLPQDEYVAHLHAMPEYMVRANAHPEDYVYKVFFFGQVKPIGYAFFKDIATFLLLTAEMNQKRFEEHNVAVEHGDVLVQLPASMKHKPRDALSLDLMEAVAVKSRTWYYFAAAFALLAMGATGYALWSWMNGGKADVESHGDTYPNSPAKKPGVVDMKTAPKEVVRQIEAHCHVSTHELTEVVGKQTLRIECTTLYDGSPRHWSGTGVGIYGRTLVTATHVVQGVVDAMKEDARFTVKIGGYKIVGSDLVFRNDPKTHKTLIDVLDVRFPKFRDLRDRFLLNPLSPDIHRVSVVLVHSQDDGVVADEQTGLYSLKKRTVALEFVPSKAVTTQTMLEPAFRGSVIRKFDKEDLMDISVPTTFGDSGSIAILDPVKDGRKELLIGVLIGGTHNRLVPHSTLSLMDQKWIASMAALEAHSFVTPLAKDLYTLVSDDVATLESNEDAHIPIATLKGNLPVVGGEYFKAGPFLGQLPCARKPPRLHGDPKPSVAALKKLFTPLFNCESHTVEIMASIVPGIVAAIPAPYRRRELSKVEAINGALDVAYSRPLRRDTGPGARFKMLVPDGDPNRDPVNGVVYPTTGKYAWMIGRGDHFEPSPILSAAIDAIPIDTRVLLFSLKHNETRVFKDGHVFAPGFDVSELIDHEAKDARPLLGDDLAYTIFDRQYLSIFTDACYRGHLTTPCSGGLNPLNGEHWRTLWRYLRLDESRNIDVHDVKTYGASQPPELLEAGWDVIIEWHKAHGFSQHYIEQVVQCKANYFGAVFVTGRDVYKNPMPGIDGVYLTFLLNSITNEIASKTAYVARLLDLGHTLLRAVAVMESDYRCKKGGDDSADTWSDKYYKNSDVAEYLKALFNFEVTSPGKGDIKEIYSLEELDFLKRRITKDGHAPLDKSSIYNVGNFFSKANPINADTVMTAANTMLSEMYHWGRVDFEELKNALRPTCFQFGVAGQLFTFEACDRLWKEQTDPIVALEDVEDLIMAHALVMSDTTVSSIDGLTGYDDASKPLLLELAQNPALPELPMMPEGSKFVERDYRETFTWLYSDAADAVKVVRNYPTDLRSNAGFVSRCSYLRYVKFGVKVSIRLVPSAATYGALMVAWAPGITNGTSKRSLNTTFLPRYVNSHYEHLLIDANEPGPVEFVIPYIGKHNYIWTSDMFSTTTTTTQSQLEIGMFVLSVLQPLCSISEANAAPCQIIISTTVVDFEAFGPDVVTFMRRSRPQRVGTSAAESKARGVAENAAIGVKAAVSVLPYIKSVVSASNTLAAVAALPDPVNLDVPTTVMPQFDIGYPNSEGPKATAVLAPTAAAVTSDDFALMATEDFMDIKKHIGTPSMISSNVIVTPNVAGAIIKTWNVDVWMGQSQLIGSTYYTVPTKLTSIAVFHTLWRGGIKFALYFFTSKFIRARFSLVWTATPYTPAAIRQNLLSEVIDVAGSMVKCFTVPYVSVYNAQTMSDVYDSNCGYITLICETPIAPFSTGIQPNIYYALYAAAAEDMCLMGDALPTHGYVFLEGNEMNPRKLFMKPFPPLAGMKSTGVANVSTSWEVTSLRSMFANPVPTGLGELGVTYWNEDTRVYPLAILSRNFAYWRGGYRVEGFGNAGTVNTVRLQNGTGNYGWGEAVFDYVNNHRVSVLVPWLNRDYFCSVDVAGLLATQTDLIGDQLAAFVQPIAGGFVAGDDMIFGHMVCPALFTFPASRGVKNGGRYQALKSLKALHLENLVVPRSEGKEEIEFVTVKEQRPPKYFPKP